MKIKFISGAFLLLFLLICCKSSTDILKERDEEKKKFDKYEDEYESYKYFNSTLGLSIVFDSDWVMNTKYSTFDDFQKKFTKYFSNENSEVLFIGFNKEKQIGIKCLSQELILENDKYAELLKEENLQDIKDYKIVFLNENTKITLKNINALQSIYDVTINANNEFRFITTLFLKKGFNYKLDIWINKNLYESRKDYIDKIINSINFIEVAQETKKP